MGNYYWSRGRIDLSFWRHWFLCLLPSVATASFGNKHKINDVIMTGRTFHGTNRSSPLEKIFLLRWEAYWILKRITWMGPVIKAPESTYIPDPHDVITHKMGSLKPSVFFIRHTATNPKTYDEQRAAWNRNENIGSGNFMRFAYNHLWDDSII